MTRTSVLNFVSQLGFVGAVPAHTKNDCVEGFTFDTFDPVLLKANLGNFRRCAHGRFVYVLAPDKCVRIDTNNNIVLFGTGEQAVKAFLKSVPPIKKK